MCRDFVKSVLCKLSRMQSVGAIVFSIHSKERNHLFPFLFLFLQKRRWLGYVVVQIMDHVGTTRAYTMFINHWALSRIVCSAVKVIRSSGSTGPSIRDSFFKSVAHNYHILWSGAHSIFQPCTLFLRVLCSISHFFIVGISHSDIPWIIAQYLLQAGL